MLTCILDKYGVKMYAGFSWHKPRAMRIFVSTIMNIQVPKCSEFLEVNDVSTVYLVVIHFYRLVLGRCNKYVQTILLGNCRGYTIMNMRVFWSIAPCSLVGVYRRFRGALYPRRLPSSYSTS
jgi:hypothetical protein